MEAPPRIRIAGGFLLPMTPEPHEGCADLWLEDGRIAAIGAAPPGFRAERTIEAGGALVLPSFVQGHVHLVQTLFRGLAEDLPLLPWLERRIWPLEAALDAAAVRASVRLGLAELVRGGTTSLVDMGTVHEHDVAFEEILSSGLRVASGKAMMDRDVEQRAPARLRETAQASLDASAALARRWHGGGEGRLRYAYAPRFALSCSDELLAESARVARERGFWIHTHGSENRDEIAAVERRFRTTNMGCLERFGLLFERSVVAHGVHLEERELELLFEHGSTIAHCPASNAKLASGIAPLRALLQRKIRVALGADGAACNNRLDIFREMFLAAALAKLRDGAAALPARTILSLATRDGARAIGAGEICGTLEVGKAADLVIYRPDPLHAPPERWGEELDPAEHLVWCGDASRIETVLCAGRVLVEGRRLVRCDEIELGCVAARERRRVLAHAEGLR